MHKLRQFYYQNKTKIWKTIAIIAFILIIIQLINYLTKIKNEETLKNNNTINNKTNTINNDTSNTYITSDKSSTTGEKLDGTVIKKVNEIIGEFVSSCNNGEIEKAYNILSDDCKEKLYPTIKEFQNKYVQNNFETKKIASIEHWSGNTYKINLQEDIMETGKHTYTSKQDYITIIRQNKEDKINISGFIGQEDINKSSTQYGITLTAINKQTFMDYEEYTIKVENNTQNKICLDTLENTKTIYLQDNNKMKYYSYSHEILDKLLQINPGFSTQLTIKFSKSNITKKVETIVFSDLVLNYNEFLNGNKEKQIFTLFL